MFCPSRLSLSDAARLRKGQAAELGRELLGLHRVLRGAVDGQLVLSFPPMGRALSASRDQFRRSPAPSRDLVD